MPGAHISCIAAGVARKFSRQRAASERRSGARAVAYQQPRAGGWPVSTADSSPRRSWPATSPATAGATPAPSAAAAQAAVSLGKTRTRASGTRSARSSRPASLSGSAPDGPTSHDHRLGPPAGRNRGEATTTIR